MFQPWRVCPQKPVPGQLQHLAHVPLGQHLLGPPHEEARRLPPRRLHAFVSGEDGNARALQAVLDHGRLVHEAGDAIQALADHCVEATVLARGLLDQLGKAAVARDGDVESVVCTRASGVEILAA